MMKKISFLRDVAPHANIVKFIAEVDDGGAEGPTTLLQLYIFYKEFY